MERKNGTEKKLVAKKKGEKGMNERDQGLFDILLLYNCAIFRLLAELPPFKCLNIFTFFHFIKASTELPDFSLRLRTFFQGLAKLFFFSLSLLANRPAKSSSSQTLTPPSRIDKLCTMATFLDFSSILFFESTLRSTFRLAFFFWKDNVCWGKKLFSFAWRRFSVNFCNKTKEETITLKLFTGKRAS